MFQISSRRVGTTVGLVVFGLTLLLVSAGRVGADAADGSSSVMNEQRLTAALDAYAQAQSEPERDARLAGFARARQGFASLIEHGVETAPLYVNLGNAAFQAQDPGGAVLAYHRALRIDPDNSTAKQNLIHVRSRLPIWVPTPDSSEGARGLLDARRWPVEQRRLFAALFFLVAAIGIAVSVRRKEGAWRGLAIVATAGWVMTLGSTLGPTLGSTLGPTFGSAFGSQPKDMLAVVTGDEVDARSADSLLAPLALPDPLPSGTEGDLLEAREDWSRLRLANGRDVWVRSSSITSVD